MRIRQYIGCRIFLWIRSVTNSGTEPTPIPTPIKVLDDERVASNCLTSGYIPVTNGATLEQAVGLQGGVDRYTLQELRKVMIYGRPGFIPDHIVTLDEFMYYFG